MEGYKNTVYGECRCCSAKGSHRDIMKEYYYNGIREVYFDIFLDCFNLFLSTNIKLSTLICSSCAARLRDAATFRAMVANTERQMVEALQENKDTVFVNVPVDMSAGESDVKCEDIKLEPTDIDPDYELHDTDDCFDFESKEECEVVKGEAALLARGAAPPLPTRRDLSAICPGFSAHLDELKGRIITTDAISILLQDTRHRRTLNSKRIYVTEKMVHIRNASLLLECSNMTPFRSKNRTGFPCFFCRYHCANWEKLFQHTNEHSKSEIGRALKRYGQETLVVYVDITNLKCTLCDQSVNSISELKTHLVDVHKRKYYNSSDRVMPYKLSEGDTYVCQMCGFRFETFGAIERHMNVHFRNYVCSECGNGFVTRYRLKVHAKSMHGGGSFPCEACGKVFASAQKHKNHVNAVHKRLQRFKCTSCPERFTEYFRRQRHMVQAHGAAPLRYRCGVCDKSFDRHYALSRHTKRDHLEQRDFRCEMCSYECFSRHELSVHMVRHGGTREHECTVCRKAYARKKTLKEHMRIHNNDRRFACAACGQAFVQKCSLKGHLKTHHLEYANTQ